MSGAAATARAPEPRAELLATVRQGVRSLLEGTPSYAAMAPPERRALAERMVNVGMMAASLAEEDHRLTERVRGSSRAAPLATAQSVRPRLATAQTAGNQLGMQAVQASSGVMRNMRDSIDFPEFVTSLISGVFQAILKSSTYQVGSMVDLLDNVSATSDEFNSRVDDGEVLRWAAAKFNFLTVTQGSLGLRQGVELSTVAPQLQSALDASEDEISSVDEGSLDETLMPLIKRKMGRDKQAILGTMVQMGLQRIVVDEGRLHASMDLRVDASSASQENLMERSDYRVNAGASGSVGFGPWSASASVSTSIGKVKSDDQYTSEQVGVRAGLRSSVELAFRTEQVPLDRLADERARVKIGQNARVPADVTGQSTLQAMPALTNPSVGDIPAVPAAPAAPARPAIPAAGAAGAAAPRPAAAAPRPAAGAQPAAGGGAQPAAGGGAQPAAGGGAQPAAGAGTQPRPPATGGGAQPATGGGAQPAAGAGTQPRPPATGGGAQPAAGGGAQPAAGGGAQPVAGGGAQPGAGGGQQLVGGGAQPPPGAD